MIEQFLSEFISSRLPPEQFIRNYKQNAFLRGARRYASLADYLLKPSKKAGKEYALMKRLQKLAEPLINLGSADLVVKAFQSMEPFIQAIPSGRERSKCFKIFCKIFSDAGCLEARSTGLQLFCQEQSAPLIPHPSQEYMLVNLSPKIKTGQGWQIPFSIHLVKKMLNHLEARINEQEDSNALPDLIALADFLGLKTLKNKYIRQLKEQFFRFNIYDLSETVELITVGESYKNDEIVLACLDWLLLVSACSLPLAAHTEAQEAVPHTAKIQDPSLRLLAKNFLSMAIEFDHKLNQANNGFLFKLLDNFEEICRLKTHPFIPVENLAHFAQLGKAICLLYKYPHEEEELREAIKLLIENLHGRNSSTIYYLIGLACGKGTNTEDFLSRAAIASPTWPHICVSWAKNVADGDSALDELEYALSLNSGFLPAQLAKSEKLEYDEAIEYLTSLLSEKGRHKELLLIRRSNLYAEKGDMEKRMEDINSALTIAPNAEALHKRMQYNIQMGNLHDCLPDLKQLLKLSPSNMYYLKLSAEINKELKNYQAAIQQYSGLLLKEPFDLNLHAQLIDCHYRMGSVHLADQELKLIKKKFGLNHLENYNYCRLKSLVLFHQGNYKKSLQYMKVINNTFLEKNWVDVWNKGMCHYILNEFRLGRDELSSFRGINRLQERESAQFTLLAALLEIPFTDTLKGAFSVLECKLSGDARALILSSFLHILLGEKEKAKHRIERGIKYEKEYNVVFFALYLIYFMSFYEEERVLLFIENISDFIHGFKQVLLENKQAENKEKIKKILQFLLGKSREDLFGCMICHLMEFFLIKLSVKGEKRKLEGYTREEAFHKVNNLAEKFPFSTEMRMLRDELSSMWSDS